MGWERGQLVILEKVRLEAKAIETCSEREKREEEGERKDEHAAGRYL